MQASRPRWPGSRARRETVDARARPSPLGDEADRELHRHVSPLHEPPTGVLLMGRGHRSRAGPACRSPEGCRSRMSAPSPVGAAMARSNRSGRDRVGGARRPRRSRHRRADPGARPRRRLVTHSRPYRGPETTARTPSRDAVRRPRAGLRARARGRVRGPRPPVAFVRPGPGARRARGSLRRG